MTSPTTPPDSTRRQFVRTAGVLAGGLVLSASALDTVAADASNNPAMPGRIYADDDTFATRGLTDLPPPSGNNAHAYDALYTFVAPAGDDAFPAPAADQLAVAEAAPGEREFNGGRWNEVQVRWAVDATPVLLTNDDDVDARLAAGDLVVVRTDFHYFECPLVPLK